MSRKSKWDIEAPKTKEETEEIKKPIFSEFGQIIQSMNGYEVDIDINDCEARFLLTKGSTHEESILFL
jgi:tRNA U54 and U55 pseudouridine synthase Pus10